MAVSQSRLERVYMQEESAYAVIPNSSGTATLAGTDACRHIKCDLNNDIATLVRRDKTGTRSATVGVRGRGFGRWSLEASLAPSGTPGTPPDIAPLLKSVFGQDPTVNSGTVSISGATNATPIVITTGSAHGLSDGDLIVITGVTGNTAANGAWIVTSASGSTATLVGSAGNGAYVSGGTVSKANVKYTFYDDAAPTFSLWRFRRPSTLSQEVSGGCIVSDITINLGQDIAEFTANGESKFVLQSQYFSSATDEEKMGLTAFPSEPGSPTTAGSAVPGFYGSFVSNAVTLARIRTAQLKVNNGAASTKDTFGTSLPDDVEFDERNVTLGFGCYDTDDASVFALKNAGITKTPLDFILQIGTTPGSIVVAYMRQVQVMAPQLNDNQRRFAFDVADSRAFGTSTTALNEVTLWFA